MSVKRPTQSDEPIAGLQLPILYNLVYSSRASANVDDAVVSNIIKTSQRNNPRQGITGLLVFGSGIFFQWLEGPRDNVTQLLARLTADSRHDTVVVLNESEEMRERVFPDWSMELVTTEDIRDVLLDALEESDDAATQEALRLLMHRLESGNDSFTRTPQ